MRKILDEISILPGVAGSCIFSKEGGPLCTDHQLTIDKDSIHTMGTHLIRLLQMGRMVDFKVRTAKFKFDTYTVVGMALEADSVLMTICEPNANCSLVATSAGMLVDDIRRDLAQGIALNIEDVKEVTDTAYESETVTRDDEEQTEEALALDRRTRDLFDRMKDELSGIIGPVAGMVMDECIEEVTVNGSGISSVSKLVNLLAAEIEDSSQAADFKLKCYTMSEQAGLLNQPESRESERQVARPQPTIAGLGFDEKSTAALKRIETHLARAIGPGAEALVCEQAVRLAKNGEVGSGQLRAMVNNLAAEIANPNAARDFRRLLDEFTPPDRPRRPDMDGETPSPSVVSSPTEPEIKLRPSGSPASEMHNISSPAPASAGGSGGKVSRAMAKNSVRNKVLKTPEVDSITLKKIETSLAQVMGPFASMVMEENVSKWKKNGPAEISRLPELIDTIREDINDPTQALAFNARVNVVLENLK